MENLKLSTLLSAQQIQKRVEELGKEITRRYKGEDLTAICVLRGAYMFYADLIRAVDMDLTCEFLGVSSYTHMSSSGEVKMTLDLTTPIEGRNILLVEDIVDTGLTMDYLSKALKTRKPKSLATAALLYKPAAMKVPCKLDYMGFEIENEYVVGYGLDFQGYYRNLPYVAKVENIN